MAWPPIRGRFRFACLVIFLIALASLTSSGYQQRLDSEAIREAFSLGRRSDQTTGVFLSKYVKTFPAMEKWPHVGRIDLLTPYAQIVYDAKDDLQNNNVLDAEQKYGSVDMPLIVRVQAFWATLSDLPTEDKDVWGHFEISVSQGHSLTPKKRAWLPYYVTRGEMPGFDYIVYELQFDTKTVASAPITIDVSSRDGQHVEAKFDLSKLK